MRTLVLIAALLGAAVPASLARDPGASETLSGVVAAERLLASTDGVSLALPKEELDTLGSAIERDLRTNPNDARLQLAMAIIEQTRDNHKAARDHAEKATTLEPKNAEAHYWLGNVVFGGINDAGMLDKMSLASKGRKAYETAVELDPNHVGARYGLAQFYLGAPGIAGGSEKKAKENADALLTIEGGAFFGNMLQAQIASSDKKWDDVVKFYAAAENAAADDGERSWALRSWSWTLIDQKGDPQAAMPLVDRWQTIAEADDPTPPFVRGRALLDLGKPAEAAAEYRKVLAIRPDSANASFALADCLEKAGQQEDALAQYEAFLAKHGDDKRVGDAKKAIKRLKKALGRK